MGKAPFARTEQWAILELRSCLWADRPQDSRCLLWAAYRMRWAVRPLGVVWPAGSWSVSWREVPSIRDKQLGLLGQGRRWD